MRFDDHVAQNTWLLRDVSSHRPLYFRSFLAPIASKLEIGYTTENIHPKIFDVNAKLRNMIFHMVFASTFKIDFLFSQSVSEFLVSPM